MNPTLTSPVPGNLELAAFALLVLALLAVLTLGKEMRAFRGLNFVLVALLAVGCGVACAFAAFPGAPRSGSFSWLFALALVLTLSSVFFLAGHDTGRVGVQRDHRASD